MVRKFSLDILSSKQVGSLFFEYVVKNNIHFKIYEEIKKKVFFIPERLGEEFIRREKTEYYHWAKKVDIASYIKEAGWKSFIED
jgi:hypothetical protein